MYVGRHSRAVMRLLECVVVCLLEYVAVWSGDYVSECYYGHMVLTYPCLQVGETAPVCVYSGVCGGVYLSV